MGRNQAALHLQHQQVLKPPVTAFKHPLFLWRHPPTPSSIPPHSPQVLHKFFQKKSTPGKERGVKWFQFLPSNTARQEGRQCHCWCHLRGHQGQAEGASQTGHQPWGAARKAPTGTGMVSNGEGRGEIKPWSSRLTQAAKGAEMFGTVQELENGKCSERKSLSRQRAPAFVYLSLLLFALFIRIINSGGQASSGVTALYFSQHKLCSWLQCSSGVLL